MNHNFKFYILYAILYGVILLIGEGFYHFLKMKPEWSRNFSHLVAGILSLPYPWVFSSHWWVLIIAVQSSLILYFTKSRGLIPSHHKAPGKSAGSYLFFASLYLCFLASFISKRPHYFIIPILVLSVSDVSASIIGRKFGNKQTLAVKRFLSKGKTYAGMLGFFFSSLVVVTCAYYYYLQTTLSAAFLAAMAISTATAIAEAKSSKGYDNLFIPTITLIIMYLIDVV